MTPARRRELEARVSAARRAAHADRMTDVADEQDEVEDAPPAASKTHELLLEAGIRITRKP